LARKAVTANTWRHAGRAGCDFNILKRSAARGKIELESLIVSTQYNHSAKNLGHGNGNTGANDRMCRNTLLLQMIDRSFDEIWSRL
jgi:hypothetical protein